MNSTFKSFTLPDVVVFDIDDTFYSSILPHSSALDSVLSEISINTSLDKELISSIYQKSRHLTKLDLDGTASSHSRLLYIQKTLEHIQVYFGVDLDIPFETLRCEEIYWNYYLKHIVPVPRLYEVLTLLKSLNIRMAIVTDLTARIQFRKLIKLEISHFFDFVVTSEEAGADKPNFNAFSLIRSKFEMISPNLLFWMVGDSPTKDLLGAKNELLATTFLLPTYTSSPCLNFSYIDNYLACFSDLMKYLPYD